MKPRVPRGAVLTVVGGGSAYAPGLLAALIHHSARVALSEVRLYDIAPEPLALVALLGDRMATAAGAPFVVRGVESLDEALDGAHVVLNSTRPGGLAARRVDETLPLALGIPGQETVGPGGFFFALRSVPAALGLAATMKRRAPGAWLLNYTNPTNIVTQALVDHGFEQVLGLCDQSDEDLATLRTALGLRPEVEVGFRCAGLNHATWYSDITFDGEPARLTVPLAPPSDLDAEHALRFALSQKLARDVGDGWPNSYLPYYEAPERFVELSRRVGPRTDAILAALPDYYAHFRSEAQRARPELRHHRGTHGFGDLAVRALIALRAAKPHRLVLNLPASIATGVASNTVVEAPVGLSREGVVGESPPPVPPRLRDLLQQLERYQRLAAVAAAVGDDDALVEALAANPLVADRDVAVALFARASARCAEGSGGAR